MARQTREHGIIVLKTHDKKTQNQHHAERDREFSLGVMHDNMKPDEHSIAEMHDNLGFHFKP